MQGRISFAVAFATILPTACGSNSPQCPEPNSYYVFVSGLNSAGESCTITFTGPDGSANYSLSPLADCNGKIAPSTCTPEGGAPQPYLCEVIGCGARIGFEGDAGRALARTVGADTFTVRFTCDGVVVDAQDVSEQTTCGL